MILGGVPLASLASQFVQSQNQNKEALSAAGYPGQPPDWLSASLKLLTVFMQWLHSIFVPNRQEYYR